MLRARSADVLQWGRDHVIAEMPAGQVRVIDYYELQWGRDHVIAEI